MIDLTKLYGVLRGVASGKDVVSREDLSRLYHEADGDWHEPGAWDVPLVEVNRLTKAAGLPPINWLVAASAAAKKDLTPVFVDRWRLPLVSATRKALKAVDWSRGDLNPAQLIRKLPVEFARQ